mgnify:CR=1 FL=1
MSTPRIALTGIGIVSPLGLDAASSWAAAQAGTSGLRAISHFDATDYATRVAGEVVDFDPSGVISSKDVRKVDRFIQLGWVAAHEALKQAGLLNENNVIDEALAPRAGCVVGSGIGGLAGIEAAHTALGQRGDKRPERAVSPFFIPSILINLLPSQIGMAYGLQGPQWAPVSACATGSHSIGHAMRTIQVGAADVMVAGGAEACICPSSVAGFGATKALSTGFNDAPPRASRPFDTARDGFVMGEGAAVLVLERWEHAIARRVPILAEISGFGESGDAHHITLPHPEGAGVKQAMRQALAEADIDGTAIDYVAAHATSTPAGDVVEVQNIAEICGEAVKVSATKSMTGHLLGAAGALSTAFTALALRDGVIPPTVNVDDLDPAVTLDVTPNHAQPHTMHAALVNAFGFGGTNASLVLKKV